jgi:hypothetical protein
MMRRAGEAGAGERAGAAPPAPPVPAAATGAGVAVDLRGGVVDADGIRRPLVLGIDRGWGVDLCWVATGGPPVGAGEWRIDVSLRPLGPGAPLRLPHQVVRSAAGPEAAARRHHRVEVPIGLVTPAHCGTPYRATATLTYRREGDEAPAVAGFADLGLVRFYDPARAGAPAAPAVRPTP